MYGVGASAVEFNNKDVYVRITDIEDKSRKLMSRNFTSPSIVNEKYLLKDKDILFARTGASTGKTYIHENYELKYDYYFAGFLIKFEILKSYYPDFIYQYTLTNSYENWVKVMSVRSGQPGINSEEYSKLKLNIPRYEEQKKIGDFFSKLDRQIELEEQKLEKLEEQKKGYMQKIFSQELRFKDENGNDYDEWKEEKLENIADFQNGKAHENLVSIEGEYVLVNSKFISTDTRIKKHVSQQLTPLNKEDIAIVMSDIPNGKALAKCFLVDENNKYSLNQRIGRIYNILGDSRFLYLILNRNKQLLKYDSGVGQTNLKKSEITDILLNWPIKEEQQKIGDFFRKIDELIEKQSEKIEVLNMRKKGFLQKMFV
ncbi:restriction endonuclease subunit S [Staphylococcus arlettae]|uniref:restriction endonuclease subunit S n=1 Tax=Staphylococcus arlettae TaxID=29378 RepID=UPI001FD9297D